MQLPTSLVVVVKKVHSIIFGDHKQEVMYNGGKVTIAVVLTMLFPTLIEMHPEFDAPGLLPDMAFVFERGSTSR